MDRNVVIWLTDSDYRKLRQLVADLGQASGGDAARVETLEELLDLARVVSPEAIPQDIVTMNSRVTYQDLHTGERRSATVVYPEDADPATARTSVLSPVGTALLGLQEGAEATLPLPRGTTARIRILEVNYQPEAQGEYSL